MTVVLIVLAFAALTGAWVALMFVTRTDSKVHRPLTRDEQLRVEIKAQVDRFTEGMRQLQQAFASAQPSIMQAAEGFRRLGDAVAKTEGK
jgi:hypothetical protein